MASCTACFSASDAGRRTRVRALRRAPSESPPDAPIALLAIVATAATAYETIIALPDANQTYRELTFNAVASGAESDIKPRVFFTNFPNRVLYVRDIPPSGGWRDIFLADATQPDRTTVYVARQGRLAIDRAKRKVELVLENGTMHTTYPNRPEAYDGNTFERQVLDMDADAVFPRTHIIKGDNEKSIAELRQTAADNAAHGRRTTVSSTPSSRSFRCRRRVSCWR